MNMKRQYIQVFNIGTCPVRVLKRIEGDWEVLNIVINPGGTAPFPINDKLGFIGIGGEPQIDCK